MRKSTLPRGFAFGVSCLVGMAVVLVVVIAVAVKKHGGVNAVAVAGRHVANAVQNGNQDQWPKKIAVFRGVGVQDGIGSFRVDDDWELRWECRNGPGFITVNQNGKEYKSIFDQEKGIIRSSGRRSYVDGGEYTVDISGFLYKFNGPWKIEIWQNSNRIE